MQSDISFLVGLKNNIDYTRFFYENVRHLYRDVEIVFVSYGSTDGTHEWLAQLDDPFLKYFCSEDTKTLSDTYNKAIEIATRKYVCFLHNDMVLGKYFLKNLSEDILEDELNFYKVVEPPVFTGDLRDWKETKDFGDEIKDFNFSQFSDFEKEYISDQKKYTTETADISFFLCAQRATLMKIGGLDNLFNPMFCEDDDLIIRLRLLGLKTIQLHRALVYHFVSKTSRFSIEYENKTKTIEERSKKNFLRKWGFRNGSQLIAKYDVGIILKHGNISELSKLEPFASTIYVDFPFQEYLRTEQSETKYNLKERIKPISELKPHDVMIDVNGKIVNDKTLSLIENISQIIFENKSKYINPGIFSRFFYQNFKPYRPLIFFSEAKRKEKSLIYKELF